MYRRLAAAIVLFASTSGLGGQGAAELTPSEVFSETLHEVRQVRGLGIGKRLDFRLVPSSELAQRHARAWPRLKDDASSFASLGLLIPGIDAGKKLGEVAARMLSIDYEAKSATVFVPTETTKLGRYVAKLLAAQAIGRALDTERYDLEAKLARAKTFDEAFVLVALREGASLLTMSEWATVHREGWTMPERLGIKDWERARNDTSTRSPRFFSVQLAAGLLGRSFFAKSQGGTSLLPQIASGASKRIEGAFRELPSSSEQVLHPEKYWSSSRDEPVTLAGEEGFLQVLAQLAGSELRDVNTLGEFGCGIAVTPLLQRSDPKIVDTQIATAAYWSPRASEGWGGDRLYVFGSPAGSAGETTAAKPSMAWITFWDSERDASEFAGTFGAGNGKRMGFVTSHRGRVVVAASGALAAKVDDVHQTLRDKGQPVRAGRSFSLSDEAAAPQKD